MYQRGDCGDGGTKCCSLAQRSPVLQESEIIDGPAAKDLIPHRAGTRLYSALGQGLGDLPIEGGCVFLALAQRVIVLLSLAVINRG